MSTTVTYKGNTIATLNNQTKTLTTEGTWLDANIVVTDTISSETIVLDTLSVSSNGTYTPTSGTAYSSVTVNVPPNNQNKTVTPTTSQQSVTFDVDNNNYTGLGTVTVNAIPSNYITTSDADATTEDILLNKTAYVNRTKITGSMTNNGATGGTITSQSGTYTIPAGYTSGGTVTATLPATTLTNTVINGAAFEETTGDYGWRTTIHLDAGYYNAVNLTKDFSTMLPAPATEANAAQVLIGYDLYNHEGQLISGSMTNNAAYNATLTDGQTSITIPAGYHNGQGVVQHATVAVPNPTISVNAFGLITASGSWTKGFTTNNSYSNTQQLSTQAAATITPTTTNQTIAAGTYLTGTQTIAGDSNLTANNIKHGVNIFGTTGTFGAKIENIIAAPSDRGQTITFTGLKAQPLAFSCTLEDQGTFTSVRTVYNVVYDGNKVYNLTSYRSGSSLLIYKYENCTFTYNNGTLTITSPSSGVNGVFQAFDHRLLYVYEE